MNHAIPAAFGLTIAAMPVSLWAEPITATDLDLLPAAQVYVLGEIHDNPQHHLNQARAVASVEPAAVVWEMLTPEQAAAMPADRDDPAALAEALGWADSGWPDFALYYPIIEAAGQAAHFGGGVPRPQAQRAFSEGAATVFGDEAGVYRLDEALPEPEQGQREQEQFEAHCEAMPLSMMGGMVEAQRLRDAALARAALEALHETGGPVAVIAGSGHSRRDRGVPAMLELAEPGIPVFSLGQVEADPGEAAPWQAWIITEAIERPDPCEAFR